MAVKTVQATIIRDQCRSYKLGDEYGQKSIRKGRWHRSEL